LKFFFLKENNQPLESSKEQAKNLKELSESAKDFKSGARVDGIMKGLVASLTEKEMANLAAYYNCVNLWVS
jgi:cytochrome c553